MNKLVLALSFITAASIAFVPRTIHAEEKILIDSEVIVKKDAPFSRAFTSKGGSYSLNVTGIKQAGKGFTVKIVSLPAASRGASGSAFRFSGLEKLHLDPDRGLVLM